MKKIYSLIISIIVYLIISYINQFIAQNQIYPYEELPPLYDKLHNILPILSAHLPDIGLIFLVLYFILRWIIKDISILINFLWIVSLLFIGRAILISITKFPRILKYCENNNYCFNIFMKSWNKCPDYMYSGHTIHCVLIALFTLYLPCKYIEKIIIILATIIELIFIIASRMHYTIDVLVALLVTILIFFSWTGIDNIMTNIYNGGIYGKILQKTI